MNTDSQTPTIEELAERVDALENAVAELRAETYGREADEKPAIKPRIDFTAAGGTCIYHPLDHVRRNSGRA